MRSETSFELDGDLIVVDAVVVGATGRADARLVVDTGAVLTTLTPEIATAIGYSAAASLKPTVTRTAAADERLPDPARRAGDPRRHGARRPRERGAPRLRHRGCARDELPARLQPGDPAAPAPDRRRARRGLTPVSASPRPRLRRARGGRRG